MPGAPTKVRAAITEELNAAAGLFSNRDPTGWRHLERAHVLSQPWASTHVRVHFVMLRRGWRDRDRTEVLGQTSRLLVAGPGSLLRKYPIGNTGRARVPATRPMPVDDDLAALLALVGKPTAA